MDALLRPPVFVFLLYIAALSAGCAGTPRRPPASALQPSQRFFRTAARLFTAQQLPYAALMYGWGGRPLDVYYGDLAFRTPVIAPPMNTP